MRVRLALRGLAAGGLGLLVAATTLVTPAWAHVEVSADKPQAGATNVTVTFTGEAESTTGGIQSEQVFLPTGIAPEQVTLGSAPAGWALTKAADNVTVSGQALPVGTDAEFSIVIAQLPATATELVFKTLETYSDGTVSRWIDLQQPGQAEPEHPAPTLQLTGAVATTPTSAAPVTTEANPPVASSAAAVAGSDSGGSGWTIAAIVAIVLVVAAAVAITVMRRRRTPPAT
jgi:Domain of unkown function (DUF1775)